MPLHLDTPTPGASFDPERFPIRGWVWLKERHAQLAALEAWSGDQLLGQTSAFIPRPDANARLGLPAAAGTGFEIVASHPGAAPGELLKLELRARFRDNDAALSVFSTVLTPPPPERSPLATLRAHLPANARGLEIGAHALPVPGLSPYFTDTVAEYVGTAGRVDFLADATSLPIPDDTLDYLCSSHVLEHLPDPLASLHEWHRVLRPGGWLYLVVPDKRYTFDSPRAVTTIVHLLDDFLHARTAATSLEHVDEFVLNADWAQLLPSTPLAQRPREQVASRQRYLDAIAAGQAIDFHFHTFTPESLDRLLHTAGFIDESGQNLRFELVAAAERFPPGRADGIGLLLRKTGEPNRASLIAETFQLLHARPEIAPLPLVCPVSLAPLREEIASDGSRTLVTADNGHRYPIAGSGPDLLPPAGARPLRAWSDAGWRAREHAAAHARLGKSDAGKAMIDEPAADTSIDPLGFFVRGWVWLGAQQTRIAGIEAWHGDTLVGETGALYPRDDVTRALQLRAGTCCGFELLAHESAAAPGQAIELHLRVRFTNGARTPVLARQPVTTIGRDYRTNHFGVLLKRANTALQGRTNIFSQGKAASAANAEVTLLLRRYLASPPRKIVEVACGLGPYGRELRGAGFDWIGTESDVICCQELTRLGLPHRHVAGVVLPFPDASFDAALSLDQLNRVDDPSQVLQELQRVSPRQLIVSVPNCELLGYLWDHRSTPWHMLDLGQKKYFTRWSLEALLLQFYARVEVRFHSPFPLRTVEGTPLYYHLFAIAQT